MMRAERFRVACFHPYAAVDKFALDTIATMIFVVGSTDIRSWRRVAVTLAFIPFVNAELFPR